MSRRQLITNGMYVYYIDMILPHLTEGAAYLYYRRLLQRLAVLILDPPRTPASG